jgi:uncharacterized ferritin-like protein (DUF455 family)
VHEARGLDVLPSTVQKFRGNGDAESAALLEDVIYAVSGVLHVWLETAGTHRASRGVKFGVGRRVLLHAYESGGGKGRHRAVCNASATLLAALSSTCDLSCDQT